VRLKKKKSTTPIGNQTRDLPARRVAPQLNHFQNTWSFFFNKMKLTSTDYPGSCAPSAWLMAGPINTNRQGKKELQDWLTLYQLQRSFITECGERMPN
jgi:hypothetical protein